MNKYLSMSAAAALATTAAGSAEAGTYSVHFGGGASYCDGIIGTSNGAVFAGRHIYTHCGSGTNLRIEGLMEKLKGDPVGKHNVNFSDDSLAFNYHENYAISFDIQTPIVAGNKWDAWINNMGSTAYIANSGVLLAGQYAKMVPHGQKGISTLSKVIAALHLERPATDSEK
ncbi:MAG TPA: hypothetical protein VII49_03130 [Rhizomicrobium sp.]